MSKKTWYPPGGMKELRAALAKLHPERADGSATAIGPGVAGGGQPAGANEGNSASGVLNSAEESAADGGGGVVGASGSAAAIVAGVAGGGQPAEANEGNSASGALNSASTDAANGGGGVVGTDVSATANGVNVAAIRTRRDAANASPSKSKETDARKKRGNQPAVGIIPRKPKPNL
jgi:hypothetical protein